MGSIIRRTIHTFPWGDDIIEEVNDPAGANLITSYPGGKLYQRIWARELNNNGLITTYRYHPKTGELTSIDYSDTSPDKNFNYTRVGKQQTITDGVGSRTFTYTDALQLDTEFCSMV